MAKQVFEYFTTSSRTFQAAKGTLSEGDFHVSFVEFPPLTNELFAVECEVKPLLGLCIAFCSLSRIKA